MHDETITLGGGCFWCVEAAYSMINGITKVVSGYAGGQAVNPSYEQVSGGATGHAEVVQISFDPNVINLADILEIFWTIHDPTTPNRQGSDVGPQYRSIILYDNEAQRKIAAESLKKAQQLWDRPIVTELQPLEHFYPAEDYHQDYFSKNPRAAYCQIVINPKLQHLRERFAERLKA